jgi:hypothetical protein
LLLVLMQHRLLVGAEYCSAGGAALFASTAAAAAAAGLVIAALFDVLSSWRVPAACPAGEPARAALLAVGEAADAAFCVLLLPMQHCSLLVGAALFAVLSTWKVPAACLG